MTTELMTIEQDRFLPALSQQQALQRRDALVAFVREIMTPDVDYGTIPGAGDKKVLFKPGAERLCSFFGLTPDFQVVKEIENWDADEPLFYYRYKCRLLRDGRVVGDGEGSCNSRESKYRWRDAKRLCPSCGQPAIIKGKEEFGGGWLCFKKQGGCGAKYPVGDQAIEGQQIGRVPNPDMCDLVNTIQKMAQKRAFIGACLIAVNASEYFTQDLDDLPQPAVAPVEASFGPRTTETLTTELKQARARLVTMGGKPRPLTTKQVEVMDAAALADEILATNNAAWELAVSEIATLRSEAQAKAQADVDELFPDKAPDAPVNGRRGRVVVEDLPL